MHLLAHDLLNIGIEGNTALASLGQQPLLYFRCFRSIVTVTRSLLPLMILGNGTSARDVWPSLSI